MTVNELRKCLEELEMQGKGDLSVMTNVRIRDLEGGTSQDVAPVSVAHLAHLKKTLWTKNSEVLMLDLGQLGVIGLYM